MATSYRRAAVALSAFVFLFATPALTRAADVTVSPIEDVQSAAQDQTVAAPDSQPAESLVDTTPTAPIADVVADTGSMSAMNGMTSEDAATGQQTSTTIKTSLPQADDASGALLYGYPINVPPGRNGMQPDLRLQYSSQSNGLGSWLGQGWDVSIPSVERLKKKGIGTLLTDGYFTSSMSGELVNSASGVYAAKVENGDFLSYAYAQTPATNAVQMDAAVGLADQSHDPYVLSVTVNDHPNRYLLCSFTTYPNAQTVTAVTFNGTSMTEVATHTSEGAGRTYLYGLVNPPTGTHDFSVTQTYGYGASGGCAVYFNVDQTTPVGGTASATGNGTSPSVSVYVGSGGLLATALGQSNYTGTATLAGTLIYDSGDQNGYRNLQGYVVGSGTTTATWSNNGSGCCKAWGLFGAALNLASGGASDEVNEWTVKDKRGLTYLFGSASSSRMTDVNDATKTFKWMLSEVRDTNDNYVRYEYYKNGGQIYPSKIFYTGHGSTDGIFEVDFLRESRTDHPTQYNYGFGVATNYRINEIDVKTNGTWTRKYALAYSSGDDGHTVRSILSTVVESGQDEVTSASTTLPAQAFGYQKMTYPSSDQAWQSDTSYDWPNAVDCDGTHGALLVTDDGYFKNVRIADVNGDGLPDLLYSIKDWNGRSCSAVYLHESSGNGWAYDSSWSIPMPFTDAMNTHKDLWGEQLVDVNGDNLIDIVYGCKGCGGSPSSYQSGVYINSATGWTLDANYAWPEDYKDSNHNPGTPLIFTDDNGYPQGVQAVDINGDGLVDLVKYRLVTGGSPDVMAWINKGDGTGWSRNTDWLPPKPYSNYDYGSDMGVRMTDLNNDGLVDIVYSRVISYPYDTGVYINNGKGWTFDSGYVLPTDAYYGNSPVAFVQDTGSDRGTRIMDVNGDGYPDLVRSVSGCSCVYINNTDGTGWTYKSTINAPVNFVDGSGVNGLGVLVADVNNDGLDDLVQASYLSGSTTHHVYVNVGSAADVLNRITYPHGGVTSVLYKPTSQYIGSGTSTIASPNLPYALQTVSQISNDNGLGTISTVTRSYEGGKNWYDGPYDHKFSGFARIIRTDAATNTTTTFYHQGDATDSSRGEYGDHISKAGKPYRVETRNAAGNLYGLTVNEWDRADLGSGASFVKLARSTSSDFDGNSGHKDKAAEYAYDGYGNTTTETDWGEVTAGDDGSFSDTGSDKFTRGFTYTSATSTYVVGLTVSASTTDQTGDKVNESRYYYDTLSLGSVDKGNLTKKEDWKSGSSYVNSQKAYDGTYGLVTSDTDPRGKVTSYAYDSYNLYPATVTNPLSQSTQLAYDYSLGKPKQAIDPNLLMTQTTYDGLDRVLAEKQPDQSATSTMVTRADYAYVDSALNASVKKTNWLDGATSTDVWTYMDGLDRPIQVRARAEATNTYAVSDVAYDTLGLTLKESLPYFSTGSASTTPSATASLYTTYAYDPLMRVATSTNAVGTTLYSYDDWKTSVTDPRDKVKNLYRDAYGRLDKVDEINGGSPYVTAYEYDGNGSLTKITDPEADIRNFTYDGLGRRLTAEDLHAWGDSTFGTWTYAYDDAGNATSVVDPKNQTVNYVFDDLNRPTSEDFAGQGGTEATFTYDSCQYGLGKLCSASNTAAVAAYQYGPTGQATRVTKTIGATAYQTDTAYDRQGNVLTVTNPDSSQVQYAYSAAGLPDAVSRKESGDGSWTAVITNFDWSPTGKPTVIAFANSASTTNTYDASNLYRLTSRVTTIPGGAKAQNLAYTYDADGNVTGIVDNSDTGSKNTMAYGYDDLNRLVSATSTNATSGNFVQTYGYDDLGNFVTRSDAGNYSYSQNAKINPDAVTQVGTKGYDYDSNGNMTSAGYTNYAWDYKNRLTQVTDATGTLDETSDYYPTGSANLLDKYCLR